jgi:probable F420-dependent oxidoreductase
MRIGLAAFVTEYSISAPALAMAAEERGFDCLLFPEHTHIPCSRQTPHPKGELPRHYLHTLDPFAVLGAAAAVTERIRLGTGVCLVTEHHPITLAKAVATIDHLAGGRFLFGVGAGWNAEEMRNHGTDPARRWAVTCERIRAMQAIWSADEAAYHGKTVDFDPIWSWPKPVNKPWPPILLGRSGTVALDHVLEYADEWLPMYARVHRSIGEDIAELRRRAADRDRKAPGVTMFWAPPEVARLEELAAAGVDRALIEVPVADEAEVVRTLDSWCPLVERFHARPA